MKIIRFAISNSENPEDPKDNIDILFRNIFDLNNWKNKFSPLLLIDTTSDSHRNLIDQIQIVLDYLDYWRENKITDYNPSFEFTLEYFLPDDGYYPNRFIRAKKSNRSKKLDLNLKFSYTFDTNSLPEDGRDWKAVDSDTYATDILLFSPDYLPIELIGKEQEDTPSNPVLTQNFIIDLTCRFSTEQDAIIATTSAFLIADVDRENIFLFSPHNSDDRRVTNPDFQTFGAGIDDIYRRIFKTKDMSGQATALMKNLMTCEDRELIKASLALFGDSVNKAFLWDRYRILGQDSNNNQ